MKKFENTHYGWKDLEPTDAHTHILPAVIKRIQQLSQGKSMKILDIGCGNGYVASKLAEMGHSLIGVDSSPDGIDIASLAYPTLHFKVCSVYDEKLANTVGELVDCIISVEVVEHLFFPRKLLEQSYRILRKGGHLLVSAPYHGYLKNLALSFGNGWDRHFKVEWDGGHIKFFSKRTLTRMVCDVGFEDPCFYGVGRLPWLWKSMIMVAEK